MKQQQRTEQVGNASRSRLERWLTRSCWWAPTVLGHAVCARNIFSTLLRFRPLHDSPLSHQKTAVCQKIPKFFFFFFVFFWPCVLCFSSSVLFNSAICVFFVWLQMIETYGTSVWDWPRKCWQFVLPQAGARLWNATAVAVGVAAVPGCTTRGGPATGGTPSTAWPRSSRFATCAKWSTESSPSIRINWTNSSRGIPSTCTTPSRKNRSPGTYYSRPRRWPAAAAGPFSAKATYLAAASYMSSCLSGTRFFLDSSASKCLQMNERLPLASLMVTWSEGKRAGQVVRHTVCVFFHLLSSSLFHHLLFHFLGLLPK